MPLSGLLHCFDDVSRIQKIEPPTPTPTPQSQQEARPILSLEVDHVHQWNGCACTVHPHTSQCRGNRMRNPNICVPTRLVCHYHHMLVLFLASCEVVLLVGVLHHLFCVYDLSCAGIWGSVFAAGSLEKGERGGNSFCVCGGREGAGPWEAEFSFRGGGR